MMRENGQYFEKRITVRVEKNDDVYWYFENEDMFDFPGVTPEIDMGTIVETEFGEIYFPPENNGQ